MLCPNCGTENHGESRFCVSCASLLPVSPSDYDTDGPNRVSKDLGPRSILLGDDVPARLEANVTGVAVPDFVDDLEISESNYIGFRPPDENVDSLLWPSETVFAPSGEVGEDVSIEYAEPTESMFEDAQADDVFEQSLKIPLSQEIVALRSSLKESTTNPDLEEKSDTVIENQMPKEADGVFVGQESSIPLVDIRRDAEARPRRSPLLRTVGISLGFLAAFAAGVGTGAFFFRTPKVDTPPPVEPPALITRPQHPAAPFGMVYVPGGQFMMGSDTGDQFSRPAHHVGVDPFFIDRTEVTNEDYERFVRATGHKLPPDWANGIYPDGKGQFPVTGVSWYDAAEYAEWAGKRLPTEEEWEYAARGTDERVYPWGNEWDPKLANAGHNSAGLREVGEGGKSPFGLYDMSGNAWEWTASDAASYPGGKEEFPSSKLHLKIIRGGNWQSDSRSASVVFRGYYGAVGEREYSGTSFRCVRDVDRE